MLGRVVGGFLTGIVMAQASFAGTAATDWLARMAESHRQLNYSGIVTYQVGERVNSFRISHYVGNGQEFESLEALDGNEAEWVRSGHDVNCIHPGPEMIRLLGERADGGLTQQYSIAIDGQTRVAGRDGVVMKISPKDEYRLGYTLTLDEETGLMLRSEILSEQGKVLERFQYVALEFDSENGAAVSSQALQVSHKVPVRGAAARSETLREWRPTWVPSGFRLAEVEGEDVNGMTFTDGLAVISVFVESLNPATAKAASEQPMRRGASVSYSVAVPERQALVSVVGEVPMLTAKQIARSLEWPRQ